MVLIFSPELLRNYRCQSLERNTFERKYLWENIRANNELSEGISERNQNEL